MALSPDSSAKDVWKTTYFVRRVCVTLEEVRGLAQEASKHGNQSKDKATRLVYGQLSALVKLLNRNTAVFAPVRNTVGAHLRPSNASKDKTVNVVEKVLKNFPDLTADFWVNLDLPQHTSFHGITVNAIHLAWPDVDTGRKLKLAHRCLARAVLKTAKPVLQAIDELLVLHWMQLGIVKESIGVRASKERGFLPLDELNSR